MDPEAIRIQPIQIRQLILFKAQMWKSDLNRHCLKLVTAD